MNNDFSKIYLQILNEQKSPTTFTPEALLNDVKNKCFYSIGQFMFYSVEELKQFADDDNKKLFKIFVNNLKDKNDFGMLIIYFSSIESLDEILNKHGYFNPHQNFKNFSMNKVYRQFKKFFENTNKDGANFNSIDIYPELGCVIGINEEKIKSNRDFEKVLDHQINHYFEKMNIHYDLENQVDEIIDVNNEEIIKKLSDFYHIDFKRKDSFINDLKHHFFNFDQFRSMSADVFHEIIRYNENHLKQLDFHEFINDIQNCDYSKYDLDVQDYIIFCWICKKISANRWQILINGIKKAISIRKNIFQKFFIKGKDIFRNFILRFK